MLQALAAAAVIDGPLVTVTHQCFSRGSCVVTKQAKASPSSATPPPPPPSSSSSSSSSSPPPPPPLSPHDYISITITTTSLPNQETLAFLRASLPRQHLHVTTPTPTPTPCCHPHHSFHIHVVFILIVAPTDGDFRFSFAS